MSEGNKEVLSLELLTAVSAQDTRLAEQLLRDGADINYEYQPTGYAKNTCLFEAIDSADLTTVKWVLEHGADPELYNENATTPLARAISAGLIEVVKYLLNHGANINGNSGMCGETPIMNALIENQIEILKYLIIRGADPYIKDYDGKDWFFHARSYGFRLDVDL
jgi:ankyrin repeat protein